MMCMSLIPCTSQCVYQQDGVCTLDSAAAAGLPALGGACGASSDPGAEYR